MSNEIDDIVFNNSKVKVREIADMVSILTEHVVNILLVHCWMRKVCARWVPQLFTNDQKRIRVTTSEYNLAYSNHNSKGFFRCLATMDV